MKDTEYREMDAVEDLLTWEEENDALLPMEPDDIAALEEQGYVVDLTTGEVFRDPDGSLQDKYTTSAVQR